MPEGILLIGNDRKFKDSFIKVAAGIAGDIPCFWAEDISMARDLLIMKGAPHVIFLDLDLPQEQGWQFLSTLNNRYKTVPVVIYGRLIIRQDWERARALGAKAYCGKDASQDYLREVVTAITDRIRQGTLASMDGIVYG